MNFFLNTKKFYNVLLVAIIINILQIILFSSDIFIYDVSKIKYPLLSLSLVNNFFLTCAFLWLFCFNRIVFKIVAYIGIIITIIFSYYVYWYKFSLTSDIISELRENIGLAGTFINIKKVLIILVSSVGILTIYELINIKALSFESTQKNSILSSLGVLLGFILLYLISLAILNPYMKKCQGRNKMASLTYGHFPKNIFSSLIDIYKFSYSRRKLFNSNLYYKERLEHYYNQSKADNYTLSKNIPNTIVFIFGESLNSSHLQPNGYSKKTLPLLSKRENMVFFKHPISCATITSKAQPCISKGILTHDMNFSDKSFYTYLLNSRNIKSFIYILSQLGYSSTFLTVGNEGTSLKILENEANKRIFLTYDGENRIWDIDFVEKNYKKALQDTVNSLAEKKLIIVYLEGSHYLYDKNSNKAHSVFQPTFKDAIINNATTSQDREKIINTYDNTIVYTDYIMDFTISVLEKSKQNAVLYFFSDHGDQLIDTKMTPHGMPYPLAQEKYPDVIQPGAFLWFSNEWIKNINPNALKNANKHKELPFHYEKIFHSVLDCAGVKSKYIKENMSICQP